MPPCREDACSWYDGALVEEEHRLQQHLCTFRSYKASIHGNKIRKSWLFKGHISHQAVAFPVVACCRLSAPVQGLQGQAEGSKAATAAVAGGLWWGSCLSSSHCACLNPLWYAPVILCEAKLHFCRPLSFCKPSTEDCPAPPDDQQEIASLAGLPFKETAFHGL